MIRCPLPIICVTAVALNRNLLATRTNDCRTTKQIKHKNSNREKYLRVKSNQCLDLRTPCQGIVTPRRINRISRRGGGSARRSGSRARAQPRDSCQRMPPSTEGEIRWGNRLPYWPPRATGSLASHWRGVIFRGAPSVAGNECLLNPESSVYFRLIKNGEWVRRESRALEASCAQPGRRVEAAGDFFIFFAVTG